MFAKKKTSLPSARALFNRGAGLSVDAVTVNAESAQNSITILNEVSVELTAGRTAVLGLNGSGKSTFLKLFNGLTQPSLGTVHVHGIEVEEHLVSVRRHVGLLFSDPHAQLIMPTPVEDVELSLQKTVQDSKKRRAKALELLAQRGLSHRAESSVYDISGGERQLVALTAVLAVDPQVLLLDEPTTLLDLRNTLRLMKLLDELPQQMVISTHDLELAETCDEAIVIHQGKLIAHGKASTVLTQYRSWCAEGFPGE